MAVYADNASTSFPKPKAVGEAMARYVNEIGASPSRGSYGSAMAAQQVLIDAREALCSLFGAESPKNIIFTSGATLSLNMLIKGIYRENAHLVTTSMEHNAVMRPLAALNANVSIVNANTDGTVDAAKIEAAINSKTTAVITTHASNVCGTVLPIEEIYTICKKRNVLYIVDAAQTAGVLPVTLKYADAIAFAGHKGLYGPQGIGGFAISAELGQRLDSFVQGGTGSLSHEETMPVRLPDKFEAGTLNMPGIAGLLEGVRFLNSLEPFELINKEKELCAYLLEGFLNTNGLEVLGLKTVNGRTGVVSVNFKNADNAAVSHILDNKYGIQTRCGLHCAPRAHKTLGSFETGAVRFSLGAFNTKADTDYIISAVNAAAKEAVI